ncbi:MAG: MoxR family ATPase [Planctomycetota bacterium]|jgi:magnesium chelatase subunit I
MTAPATLGALRASGWRSRGVREELRGNLIARLRTGEEVFPGLIGYDRTVVPQVQKAILAGHDFILLGLRGQAKTRLLRALPALLDDRSPEVDGCEIHDDPFAPACATCRQRLETLGDDLPIAWRTRDERYGEKLATPDVSIADLIGDIDPIKAATRKLTFADPEVVHYGIVPRCNRGIFAINELPDLQARIQVGLLNILEEGDVQIRGFPVRLPLDMLLVFSANPEDYTNRGSIITPLRDRIASQILTHYPRTREEARAITAQEARVERTGAVPVHVPDWLADAIEEVAILARESEFVDQGSGVSARVPIALMETVVAGAERRALLHGETTAVARVADLVAAQSALTGKIELVYEGEREGLTKVAAHLAGRAVKAVFDRHFPDALAETPTGAPGKRGAPGHSARPQAAPGTDAPPPGSRDTPVADTAYSPVLEHFLSGGTLDVSDDEASPALLARLRAVPGLEALARAHLPCEDDGQLAATMELVLEGLHQGALLAKDERVGTWIYRDVFEDMARDLRS